MTAAWTRTSVVLYVLLLASQHICLLLAGRPPIDPEASWKTTPLGPRTVSKPGPLPEDPRYSILTYRRDWQWIFPVPSEWYMYIGAHGDQWRVLRVRIVERTTISKGMVLVFDRRTRSPDTTPDKLQTEDFLPRYWTRKTGLQIQDLKALEEVVGPQLEVQTKSYLFANTLLTRTRERRVMRLKPTTDSRAWGALMETEFWHTAQLIAATGRQHISEVVVHYHKPDVTDPSTELRALTAIFKSDDSVDLADDGVGGSHREDTRRGGVYWDSVYWDNLNRANVNRDNVNRDDFNWDELITLSRGNGEVSQAHATGP